LTSSWGWVYPTYKFVGMQIVLNPAPAASLYDGLKLRYYHVPRLSAVPQREFLRQWNWLLILSAAQMAMTKDDRDTTGVEKLLAQHEAVFTNAADSRSDAPLMIRPYGVW